MEKNTVWLIVIVSICIILIFLITYFYSYAFNSVCKRGSYKDAKFCKILPEIATERVAINVFTIVHFMTGVIVAYFTKITALQWFILHALFEIWESTTPVIDMFNSALFERIRVFLNTILGVEVWSKNYSGDSVLNQLCDTGAAMLGFYLGMKIRAPSFKAAKEFETPNEQEETLKY